MVQFSPGSRKLGIFSEDLNAKHQHEQLFYLLVDYSAAYLTLEDEEHREVARRRIHSLAKQLSTIQGCASRRSGTNSN